MKDIFFINVFFLEIRKRFIKHYTYLSFGKFYSLYLNLLQITIRTSKFGPTLVILSTEASGGYVLGFRINPLQQLHIIHKEISILLSEFRKFPIFGVEYTFEHQVLYNAY